MHGHSSNGICVSLKVFGALEIFAVVDFKFQIVEWIISVVKGVGSVFGLCY
jgi:hypothetical protein